MAIQFACPSCKQPIEVDEQWAEQQVACPYCHRMVTAPAESTITTDAPPAATPMGPPPQAPLAEPAGEASAGPAAPPPTATRPARNRAAIGGLVFAVAAVVLIGLGAVIIAVRLTPYIQQAQARSQDAKSAQKQVERELAANPGLVSGPAVIIVAGIGCAGVGLILSIIGLVRPQGGKVPAVLGLILSGGCLLCPCLGVLTRT